MLRFCLAALSALRAFLRCRADLSLEILALRQQVAVLKRQRPRPPLHSGDRLFWIILRCFWPRWSDVLLIVKPETVIAWHREENPDWGAPKIHGELQKLGFTIAERTVARYLRRVMSRGDPDRSGWPSCRISARFWPLVIS